MMGQASEVLGSDPRTKGVVIMQMTWSAGDHMVAREGIKTVTDLKGKTVAVQQGGPHIGMLDDILKTAQLDWSDINVKYFDALSGEGSPVEAFRNDTTISACFAVSPDMFGLCISLTGWGTGAEDTVKGAHVLVSTAELSRSIADVYVCRKISMMPTAHWFASLWLAISRRQRNWSTNVRHTRREHGTRPTPGC